MPNESIVQQAYDMCVSGVPLIQYRRKEALTFAQKKKEILEIKNICEQLNVMLIVNDDVLLALETKASGVHLGKKDMSTEEAKKILGTHMVIGRTANTFEEVQHYHKEADYIGLGPYQWTQTKKELSPILYHQGMKKTVAQCRESKIKTPIIAVGGIDTVDISALCKAGLHGVALFSGLYKARDKKHAIEQIKKAFLLACPFIFLPINTFYTIFF